MRRNRNTIIRRPTTLEQHVQLAVIHNAAHNTVRPKRKWTVNKKKLRRLMRRAGE